MSRKSVGGLVLYFAVLAGIGTLIGLMLGNPWMGFWIGTGVFVVICVFVMVLAAAFFGGIIYFFDSISGKHQK